MSATNDLALRGQAPPIWQDDVVGALSLAEAFFECHQTPTPSNQNLRVIRRAPERVRALGRAHCIQRLLLLGEGFDPTSWKLANPKPTLLVREIPRPKVQIRRKMLCAGRLRHSGNSSNRQEHMFGWASDIGICGHASANVLMCSWFSKQYWRLVRPPT